MSTSDLIHIVPIYHSAWLLIYLNFGWNLILFRDRSYWNSPLEELTTYNSNSKHILNRKLWISTSWSPWWFMVMATNCFCHKTKIRGFWKNMTNAKGCLYFLIFILLKISSHISRLRNNWRILLPLHCYFTHFLKFFWQYLFWVNKSDISSLCQQNQNIRYSCGSARRT